MTEGGGNPGRLVKGQANWHMAGELLKAGQYEQVAELLREAQVANERTGDAIPAHILDAARRICLACRQCQAEAEWHRRAYEGADQREHKLKQQLYAILDLISGSGAPETPEKREGPPDASMVEVSLPERGLPEPVERLSLWQRAQTLLGRRPAQSPEHEGPGAPAEAVTPPPVRKEEERGSPSLAVYCLGPFRVYQDDKLITDWPSGTGKCILKYMIANHGRPIPKDILMDLFWRDADPKAARNSLNVAIYGLRQALRTVRPDFPHVFFEDDCYLLNPAMTVWVDAEEFVQHYEAAQSFERRGMLVKAMEEYEVAESLYQGDLLEEDLYQDWLIPRREGLKDSYLVVLDRLSRYYLKEKRYAACTHLCREILAKDDCREDAHRRLMRCYSRQGQRNLALRQYHLCVETLARVLDVPPMQETVALYHQIRHGEAIYGPML